jgi:hypothetical protein
MIVYTLLGFFFPAFTLLSLEKKIQDFVSKKQKLKDSYGMSKKYFGPKILTTNILDINVHKMYECDKNQVPCCNVKSFKLYKV